MKKILMLVICCLMSVPAFGRCNNNGPVYPGEWFIDRNWVGGKLEARQCTEYQLYSKYVGGKDIQYCDNANEIPPGWESFALTKGNATLRIRSEVFKDKIADGFVLKDYVGKKDACYYCSLGYSYDGDKKKCVEDMAQSCAPLKDSKCEYPRHLTISGVNGCYNCARGEKSSCNAGTRIYATRAHIGGENQITNQIWECDPANRKWFNRTPSLCAGSRNLSEDVKAGRAKLTLVNPNTKNSINNASSYVVLNGEICFKYECNNGYNTTENGCVEDDDHKKGCEDSGGVYDIAKLMCVCAETKGLKLAANEKRCECLDGDGFAWNKQNNKCEKTEEAIKEEEKKEEHRRQQSAVISKNKKACTESGGTWNGGKCECDAAKHLEFKEQNVTCQCMTGYNFESGRCAITNEQARKEACEKADNAKWNEITNSCICDNAKDMFSFNYDTGRCEQDAGYKACIDATNTKWNGKECVCTVSGWEWDGAKCEKSQALIDSEKLSAAKKRISATSEWLKTKWKAFEDDRTVWKNKEGKFNTARLASDSIAGVVLGTAGGLITSNIVKKNQVKKGFDDISCTIGGQYVADWDDEFVVGVK